MNSAYLDFIRIRFLMMLAYRVNYYSGIVDLCDQYRATTFCGKRFMACRRSWAGLHFANDDLCSRFLDGAGLLLQ